ncbi:class I SAM-dependent methyltransferase [Aureivirga sp. CE67]|uniref:class I SAM-dependent methyltransferase n=1 Tax=Aureivirga sp. CE67 TaxID=1788983 RepID=UPI0018CB9636|nr:class I SAM-dependent methyltransferase [Aureivirga sp. CE67]
MSKNETKRNKKPWPTKDAMAQIYEKNLWGGEVEFYSGSGSHDPKIVEPYLKVISEFLNASETPLTVCDLGCGDFNVGKHLVKHTKKYIASDIVPDLIERNKKVFKAANLEFQCLDIAKDELPAADCVIIRQVLQHLSNTEVQSVLDKLSNYKYVILTEHIPEGEFTPNIDIISGQGIRLKKKSGLDVLAPPFNFKIKETKVLLCIKDDWKGVILTKVFEL